MNSPPPRPTHRPLDEPTLAKLRELDPDGRHGVVMRVMRTYETSLLRQSAELVEARDRGDLAAVGVLAHTLKSSSGSVGALVLSALCAEVERRIRDGDTATLGPTLENLLSEAELALGAVRAMLRT